MSAYRDPVVGGENCRREFNPFPTTSLRVVIFYTPLRAHQTSSDVLFGWGGDEMRTFIDSTEF